ncbi:hypothetical protein G3A43_07565 [Paraburkholderia aspalathi]|nr:hypothetical protein [Paraburkholderia aspalathi]MBK3780112.1 hypothetical protein [Paraburkholderia aspalathi]
MQRLWLSGLVAMAVCVPAFAGSHYVEVWNPPEARIGAAHQKAGTKAPRHRRVSMALAQAKLHHRSGVPTVATPKMATGPSNARDSQPSFDDLPRQITPEGNVLRVDGRGAKVSVQR